MNEPRQKREHRKADEVRNKRLLSAVLIRRNAEYNGTEGSRKYRCRICNLNVGLRDRTHDDEDKIFVQQVKINIPRETGEGDDVEERVYDFPPRRSALATSNKQKS